MQIQRPPSTNPQIALFSLGFRPFFLAAALYAVVSISVWMAVYLFHYELPSSPLGSMQWHAHEMIYGYALAVIAGFLLTAVKNWTGVQTLHGLPLCALLFVWVMARLLLLLGYVPAAAIADILFILCLCTALSYPIIKVRQWRQMAVLSKLILLLVCNTLFYLDALDIVAVNGINWGIYGGLYLIVGLILMIARRVLPFFISNGIKQNPSDKAIELYNSKWLDISSLVFFLGFFIAELFFQQKIIATYLAIALFAVNACRLVGWHRRGIWKKPLLWSLYLSLWSISIGFLLLAMSYLDGGAKFIAIHALAYGGIGSITLTMMARVSLGHTGRKLQPAPIMSIAFGLMVAGTIIRVALPILFPQYYLTWIGLSQATWIVAFLIFSWIYLPILSKSRIDGRPG